MNGIGGQTVAEAKERMSYSEALMWSAFIKKRGSLNLGLRVENGVAVLATQINRALGGKADMSDFMPHADQKVADLADVIKLVSGGRNGLT